VTFITAKRTKRQQGLQIKALTAGRLFVATWTSSDLIKSQYGWGEVESAKIYLASGLVEITLKHDQ
jgi:hypothetical protein